MRSTRARPNVIYTRNACTERHTFDSSAVRKIKHSIKLRGDMGSGSDDIQRGLPPVLIVNDVRCAATEPDEAMASRWCLAQQCRQHCNSRRFFASPARVTQSMASCVPDLAIAFPPFQQDSALPQVCAKQCLGRVNLASLKGTACHPHLPEPGLAEVPQYAPLARLSTLGGALTSCNSQQTSRLVAGSHTVATARPFPPSQRKLPAPSSSAATRASRSLPER